MLKLVLDGIEQVECALTFNVAAVLTGPGESLRVELLANGERVAARALTETAGQPWRVDLPARDWGGAPVLVTLRAEQARSFPLGASPDGRRLGMLLHSVDLQALDRSIRLGESVGFSEGSGSERLLAEGWSTLEPTGVWTVEERAELVLDLPDGAPSDSILVLHVTAFVTRPPELRFEVGAHGQPLAARTLRYGEADQTLEIELDEARWTIAGAWCSSCSCASRCALSTSVSAAIPGGSASTSERSPSDRAGTICASDGRPHRGFAGG